MMHGQKNIKLAIDVSGRSIQPIFKGQAVQLINAA